LPILYAFLPMFRPTLCKGFSMVLESEMDRILRLQSETLIIDIFSTYAILTEWRAFNPAC